MQLATGPDRDSRHAKSVYYSYCMSKSWRCFYIASPDIFMDWWKYLEHILSIWTRCLQGENACAISIYSFGPNHIFVVWFLRLHHSLTVSFTFPFFQIYRYLDFLYSLLEHPQAKVTLFSSFSSAITFFLHFPSLCWFEWLCTCFSSGSLVKGGDCSDSKESYGKMFGFPWLRN